MLTRAIFGNFKALRDVAIDFSSRLTVIVGPNACGKTSILQGISLLSQLANDKKYKAKFSPQMVCKIPNDRANAVFELKWQQPDREYVLHASSYGESAADDTLRVDALFINHQEVDLSKILSVYRFRADFPSTKVMRFDPSNLATPSYSGNATPVLQPNGAGLASVLAEIATGDPARFSLIQESFRAIVPLAKQVRLLREMVLVQVETNDPSGGRMNEGRIELGHKIYFDFVGASKVPAELASEGTLLILGWLTAIIGQEKQPLVLIDDIDRGLHPKAQRELIDVLRKMLELNPALQIITTSHSPYLLDKLQPEEIRLMTSGKDGAAICGTLMEHPEYARWKDLMLPGEMWSTVGEDWLRDLGKAPRG